MIFLCSSKEQAHFIQGTTKTVNIFVNFFYMKSLQFG